MSVQITTNYNEDTDVTVWREDDGRYIVETRRWFEFMSAETDFEAKWSPYFLTEREACTYADSEL